MIVDEDKEIAGFNVKKIFSNMICHKIAAFLIR